MPYNQKRSFSGQNHGQKSGPRRPSNGGGFGRNVRNNRNNNRNNTKQRINPSMFVNKTIVEQEAAPQHEVINTFADFGLNDALYANIVAAGFVAPSPIQDQTIPFALEGKDVIGLANTGTGKTAAFLLPIIDKLTTQRATNSVLIMAPTRELAQQIDAEFKKFSTNLKLYSALCVGGVNMGWQIRQLARGPHIVIGTPGRLKDFLNRGILKTETITTLVLDEADRMLDMGFVNDIRAIVGQLPEGRQTLCFSATMSDGIKSMTGDFMQDPEIVSVKVNETNDHIYQDVVHFDDDAHKRDRLTEMLQKSEFEKVIVFGETKFGVQRLSDYLEKSGIAANAIHGNKSQSQRNRALKAFANNEVNVLVATDVAARGLDIPDVSHVINFDIPQSYDDYVHRIGRTGRGGKRGVALTFVKSR
jgi:ATP-dependent RNA helicase RhlE